MVAKPLQTADQFNPNMSRVHQRYSGKLSREKTFSFFAVSEPSVKVFSAKFCNPQCARSVYAGVFHMREDHTYIIIGLKQSAKVFSAKFSFCAET